MNNCTVFSLRGNGTFNIFKKLNETRNEQQQEELKDLYEKEKEQLTQARLGCRKWKEKNMLLREKT